MSRIGKKPIEIKSAKIELKDGLISVEGSKGKLEYRYPELINVEVKDGIIFLSIDEETREKKSLYGLTRSLIQNMVTGVTEGFKKELEIRGVGYKAAAQGNKLTLNLGFSHIVEFDVPPGVVIATPTPTSIVVEGYDKQSVGQAAATIRSFKKPEPYKGKGIRYVGEYVAQKEGKKVG